MGDMKNWCFELSDMLENMDVLTNKIYAVADKLFMEQTPDSVNPFIQIMDDYALEAIKLSKTMVDGFVKKLLTVK